MARMLSLKEDRNDDDQFRHGYERHVGADTGDITGNGTFHYGQNCPFFFTYEGANVSLDGMYKGCSAFLVGSGPSLAKENYNLLKSPGVLTLGMNNSASLVRPNMWTCVDDPCRFLYSVWMDPTIMKFVPQAALKKPLWDSTFKDGKQQWRLTKTKVGDCPNIFGYRRNEKFHAPRFFTENTINWGCHKDYGGCRSVMLAAIRILFILGVRRIYLAGVDLKMDEENKYSFNEGRTASAIKNNQHTYARMLKEYFPNIAPEAKKWGLEICCCNKESDLCKIFPHVSLEDAVKEAAYHLGDVTKERTEGMYLAINEKTRHKTWEACAKATGAI